MQVAEKSENVASAESKADESYLNLKDFLKFVKLQRGMVPEGTNLEDISIGDLSLDFINSLTVSEAYKYLDSINVLSESGKEKVAEKVLRKPIDSSLSGYPSVDKPWLKYFPKEYINAQMPKCTMYEMIYNNNQDNLSGTALNYFGKKTSYEQFFQNIDTVARSFLAYGVRAGDVVTVVSLTTPVAITTLYALNRIGAIPNFVNVLSTVDEFESFFKEAQSDVIVTLDLFGGKVMEAAEKYGARLVIVYSMAEGMPSATAAGFKFKVRKLDTGFMDNEMALSWADFIAASEFYPKIKYKKNPDDIAYLGHTGGTTGFPKGVYLNDHSFNFVAQNYNLSMVHKKGDVFLNAMIPYVIYSAIDNIHMPLALSMEVVIIPKFDPAEWPTYIKKYQPNHCAIIPAYLAPMTTNDALKKMDLTCLRTVGMGGDGMNIPLEEAAIKLFTDTHTDGFNPLIKGYGMSEVCATAITEFSFASKVGSVGIPFPQNVVAAYNNEEQRECKYYEVGEIIMQCGSMMIGYKDNEEETSNLFRTHPDGSKWIHTGDLGYVDEDGFLFIEGRMKRMIMTVIDGAVYKIFPSKVENELSQHKGVYASCVVKASDGANQVLKAFVIPEESYKGSFEDLVKELRAQCSRALPDNMRPVFYEKLKDFPRTAAGKVDYKAMEE